MAVRPPSAEGALLPSHSSKASASIKSSATSNVSILLSNLRLLDLDKRSDWPDITVRTFSSKDALQNQKKRISCVEWILFRLFQILDPEITKDKLQPFFPPLEPLQSINLRAALFRCFNDLKKNGILGREVVLRKTMLDECKGEKLDEVLVIFSTLVLRKRLLAKRQKHTIPMAQAMGASTNLKPSDIPNLAPLILAHRVSLNATLQQRAEKKHVSKAFRDTIKARHEHVLQQHQDIKACMSELAPTLHSEAHVAIREEVHRNWVGSTEGSRLLFEGDTPPLSDVESKIGYTDALNAFRQNGLLPVDEAEPTLLKQLEEALKLQNQRLAQWREYDSLMRTCDLPSKDADIVRRSPNPTDDKAVEKIAFTEHQGLRLGRTSAESSEPSVTDSTSEYAKIVASMHHDLSEVVERRRRERFMSNSSLEGISTKAENTVLESQSRRNNLDHQSSGADRIPILRATSQQTKLDFFSPLKGGIYRPHSPDIGYETTQFVATPERRTLQSTQSTVPESEGTLPISSYTQQPTRLAEHSKLAGQELLSHLRSHDDSTEPSDDGVDVSSDVEVGAQNSTEEPLPPIVDHLTTSTLANRARASMALSREDSLGVLPSTAPELLPHAESSTLSSMPVVSNASTDNRRVSLADRTRQSMASIASRPHLSSQRHQPKLEKPPTSFPINQFETPTKIQAHPEPKTPAGSDLSGSRETTPREQLFSNDAEYASVFKSRPKIAASPVLSPGFDDLTLTEPDAGDLQQLDSSPLGAMGFNRWNGGSKR